MQKLYLVLFFSCLLLRLNAQDATPGVRPFGKIDIADLELKTCDFEPDANAMVLFDKADVYYAQDFKIVSERHKRVKIFNENGKAYASMRIEYNTYGQLEYITGLQVQTINLVNGKIEITPIDKKQIFTEYTDKWRTTLVFSWPNVKAGSVIEVKYKWTTNSIANLPGWFFQGKMPVRYSELSTRIPEFFHFTPHAHITQPLVKDEKTSSSQGYGGVGFENVTSVRAMANIHSLPDESCMSSDYDNLQSILFALTAISPKYGIVRNLHIEPDTWAKIGEALTDDQDFGRQYARRLPNEEGIINTAKALLTADKKIAYLFNEIKNTFKWSGIDRWYTLDGIVKTWEKKTGTSTEINLILYRLLKQAGVAAYPMLVSTREHGKVNAYNILIAQFNRAVVYIPVDSTKMYVLDATNKYNLYNEVPDNLLNSSGLYLDKENSVYDMVFLGNDIPVKEVAFINAEIKPDGKMTGTAQVSSFSYNKIKHTAKYKTDGEKKFIEYLVNGDNNLKISSVKFKNMDVDTLPLMQNIAFDFDMAGSDGNYIYLNPNVLPVLHSNRFLSEKRYTDVDFGYRDNWSVHGVYKIPAGYTVDGLPKSVNVVMPDKSLSFKRIVNHVDQTITVKYIIDHSKTIYFKEDYPAFREFNKQIHDMLNEPIVLKKS